jgi:uncharacterized NAD(P)/FAD-binding protein YdhS
MSVPRIVVAGAGASGALVATHVARAAARRGTRVAVELVDPVDRWGRGTAFGTRDREHLLNVPAVGMSALPEDPLHFLRWLEREYDEPVAPYTFAERRAYGRYLDDTVTAAFRDSLDLATLRHRRARATSVRRSGRGLVVTTDDDRQLGADAVVVATGLPEVGVHWAPDALLASPFFVANPWAPGALDVVRRDRAGLRDVLLVGSGLTMVDVALTLGRPGGRLDRRLRAISRSGRLPRVHADTALLPITPEISDWGSGLDDIVERAARHLREVEEATGDWRPAADGLRFQVQALWGRLSEEDRLRFLAGHAGRWNVRRHRMAPSSAQALDELRAGDRLAVGAGEVADVTALPTGGLRVTLTDSSSTDVGWVVNCTGPRPDIRALGDPLLDDLLRPRAGVATATLATAGMGFVTSDGRLVDSEGSTEAPVWTLGALRRGELWESTAVPEIRSQAAALATAVLDQVAPLPRRLADGRVVGGLHPVARPRDQLGLPLSTTAEAAAAYNEGLSRIMQLQSGAEEKLREAVEIDPGFALGHAALAMLGHEGGSAVDVPTSIARAREAAGARGDDRERSLVDVVARRVVDARGAGTRTLMNHIASWPRDVLAVSAAVPTIAFSGVIDVQQEAWELVEGLAPAYGDHWWYVSLLAFTRQDQERFEEAGLLAESALACEPSSGHAVHAATHVMYETGRHQAGRVWLDQWIARSGRSASHLAHFSWHGALHDLALGDVEAARRRYYSSLAAVPGVRGLVDSASLLWRWRVTLPDDAPPPAAPVLDAVPADLLDRPQTPFVALHAAVALTAVGDAARLDALRRHCADHPDPVVRTVVATVADGLADVLTGEWSRAAARLEEVLPVLVRVGGSAAQREIVEETLIWSLANAGAIDRAAALLDRRIDRRDSPLDGRRRRALTRTAVG